MPASCKPANIWPFAKTQEYPNIFLGSTPGKPEVAVSKAATASGGAGFHFFITLSYIEIFDPTPIKGLLSFFAFEINLHEFLPLNGFQHLTQRSPGAGFIGDPVERLVMLALILEFFVPETTYDMIVYHANCLHERVTNCCSNELEPSFLQIFAHGSRLRSAGGNISYFFP
jgi:hypothetical protein